MSGCQNCEKPAEEINQEPKRIVALAVWYEEGPPHEFVEPNLDIEWLVLPEDGLQAIKGLYNHVNPSNEVPYAFSLSGCDWYFMTPDGIVGGDTNTTKEEIERRYPGAVVKRGKWTSPANIDRINAEVAAWR